MAFDWSEKIAPVIEERLKCGVGKNWETVEIEFDQLVMRDNQVSLCDSATC